MSADFSPDSHLMHLQEVENHLTKMGEDYKVGSQEYKDFSTAFLERNMKRVSGGELFPADKKIIEELNYQIDYQYLEPDDNVQRQDVFDPTGDTNWGGEKTFGGFDKCQNIVSMREATNKEKKEKQDHDVGIHRISTSFAISDAKEQ